MAALFVCALPAHAGEWSGEIAAEGRYFPNDALNSAQHDGNLSVYFEPEFYHDWDDGDQRFAVTAFFRYDSGDDERSHMDLRELYWRKTIDDFELSVGLRKVFWGVTESAHLVDIVNQTDNVENLDTEDKLGQPMVDLRWVSEFGNFDFFLMPYFRERTFAGIEGRPRLPVTIDTGRALYESSDEENHLDWAVRWSHYIGDFDVGLSHFSGTGRDPTFVPEVNMSTGGVTLIPFYPQIDQTSLDLQATLGDWLWKLELLTRNELNERYTALAGGFEYTMVGLFESAIDLGLIAEYLYDDRGSNAATFANDDLAIGGRFAFNDVQSTELLAFTGIDLDNQSRFASVEGSRRIGQSWKLSLEARFFSNVDEQDLLFGLRNDDYIELVFSKFF